MVVHWLALLPVVLAADPELLNDDARSLCHYVMWSDWAHFGGGGDGHSIALYTNQSFHHIKYISAVLWRSEAGVAQSAGKQP